MKSYSFFVLLLLCLLTAACNSDECREVRHYIRYDPVYTSPQEYRVPVSTLPARKLEEPGKIYFYKHFILINKIREGVHVINNQDPTSPINLSFISIPGNLDIAILNDKLYADAYTDLLIIDIADIDQPNLLMRKEGVFNSHYHAGPNGVLSHFKETSITETLDCSMDNFGAPFFFRDNLLMVDLAFSTTFSGSSNASIGPNIGQGGSMARFTISKNHLYTIGDQSLSTFPIESSGSVGSMLETGLPWGIETIFPYKDYLFVGAFNGLHIVDIHSPTSPSHVSTFQHANACDPVVVQNDVAFVTLRSGTECEGFTNQLEVIDVKDILRPKLIHTFDMENPHGLAVEGDNLFLCEGTHGIKVFNIQDLSKIPDNLKEHLKGFDAYDAIAIHGEILLVIGKDGFRQYDYSDPSDLVLLSHIPVIRS